MSRPLKYPWGEWFASREPVHIQVEDWDVSYRHFQIACHMASKARDVPIRTKKCGAHSGCLILRNEKAARINWEAFFRLINERQNAGQQHAIWEASLKTCKPESFIRRARAQARARGLNLHVDRSVNDSAIGFTTSRIRP